MKLKNKFILCMVIFFGILKTYADEPRDIAPSSSALLSSEQLAQVATNCHQDIDHLYQQKSLVRHDKMREFIIALAIASEKCEAIKKAFLKLKQASQDYQHYHSNLTHVQNCLGNNLGSSISSSDNGANNDSAVRFSDPGTSSIQGDKSDDSLEHDIPAE